MLINAINYYHYYHVILFSNNNIENHCSTYDNIERKFLRNLFWRKTN